MNRQPCSGRPRKCQILRSSAKCKRISRAHDLSESGSIASFLTLPGHVSSILITGLYMPPNWRAHGRAGVNCLGTLTVKPTRPRVLALARFAMTVVACESARLVVTRFGEISEAEIISRNAKHCNPLHRITEPFGRRYASASLVSVLVLSSHGTNRSRF